jgi:hypothetical protein
MSASVTYINTTRTAGDVNNIAFLDQVPQLTDALLAVSRAGYRVLSMHAQIGVLPCIQLAPCTALADLVQQDRAVYYHYGLDANGRRFRHGQFQISGVRCIWVEYVDH